MRRVQETVPMEQCKSRAMTALSKRPQPASAIAVSIWPDAQWKAAQGAGAAASRILKHLERDGKARWIVMGEGRFRTWGWVAT